VPTEELRITYRRSGGIAGIDMAAECLATDLPEEQARVAADLLGATDEDQARAERGAGAAGAGSAGALSAPGPGADQFTYTVRVVSGDRSRTLSWSDSTVPDGARPLLATLAGLARPTRNG
jgi:hypothetical protein